MSPPTGRGAVGVVVPFASRFGSARVSSPALRSLSPRSPQLRSFAPLSRGSPPRARFAKRLRGHPRLPIEIFNRASLRQGGAFAANHLGIVAAGRFDRSLLGRVIDVHDAEAFGIAERPLVVVEQRPRIVTLEIHALLHRLVRGAQMLAVILDAEWIFDLAIDRVRWIVECSAVLRDVDGGL